MQRNRWEIRAAAEVSGIAYPRLIDQARAHSPGIVHVGVMLPPGIGLHRPRQISASGHYCVVSGSSVIAGSESLGLCKQMIELDQVFIGVVWIWHLALIHVTWLV